MGKDVKLTFKKSKVNFFDRRQVQERLGKKKTEMLLRQGAMVRKVAQRSQRRKKGSSAPGTAPNAHKGYMRDFMIFALDPADDTVVIGPARLGTSKVPTTIGRGGVIEVMGVYDFRGRFVPAWKMSRVGREAARRTGRLVKIKAKVAARPFMELAVKASKPTLDKIGREYFTPKK